MPKDCMERAEEIWNAHREKFAAFESLLNEYNERYNLTAIRGEREVKVKHFLDSLAGESFFPKGTSVAEVGSGAGFPSVPLLIAREDLKFTLFESTGKKCAFLRAAVQELGLRAEVVCARAEDAARESFREAFDAVCARAVARLNTLSEYCLPLVKKGGVFLAWKSGRDEVGEAARAISLLGGGEAQIYPYTLPEGAGERTLVCVPKARSTPEKYPRGQGRERRNPL